LEVLPEIYEHVKKRIKKNNPAHDFEHVLRVCQNAENLCSKEKANKKLVLYAALLHDIVSYPKNHKKSKSSSKKSSLEAKKILQKFSVPDHEIKIITDAISSHSFSKNKKAKTFVGKILQDADRLDAIGSIGIARTFAVGGSESRSFYNKLDPFCNKRKPDDKRWTLDHFFKKLLLIENKMNTSSGKNEAKLRTKILRNFLSNLKREI